VGDQPGGYLQNGKGGYRGRGAIKRAVTKRGGIKRARIG